MPLWFGKSNRAVEIAKILRIIALILEGTRLDVIYARFEIFRNLDLIFCGGEKFSLRSHRKHIWDGLFLGARILDQNLRDQNLDPLIGKEVLEEHLFILRFELADWNLSQILHFDLFGSDLGRAHILELSQNSTLPQISFSLGQVLQKESK